MKKRPHLLPAVLLPLALATAHAQPATVRIDATAVKAISPDLVGIFFEDLSYYVQQLFSVHNGDTYLETSVGGQKKRLRPRGSAELAHRHPDPPPTIAVPATLASGALVSEPNPSHISFPCRPPHP